MAEPIIVKGIQTTNQGVVKYDFNSLDNIPTAGYEQLGLVAVDGETMDIDENGIIKPVVNEWTYINYIMDNSISIEKNIYKDYNLDYVLPDDGNDYLIELSLEGHHTYTNYSTVKIDITSGYLIDKGVGDYPYTLCYSTYFTVPSSTLVQSYFGRIIIPIIGDAKTFFIKHTGTADSTDIDKITIIRYKKM